jgi:hypothetical protein
MSAETIATDSFVNLLAGLDDAQPTQALLPTTADGDGVSEWHW